MFKLVKILNSGVNTAEPLYLPKDKSLRLDFGSLAKLSGGKIVAAGAADTPTHVVAEKSDGGDKILVFEISRDMIFETVVTEDPTALMLGDSVKLEIAEGSAIAVSATVGGKAIIYDLESAKEIGDSVLVRF